jgi:cytochrome c oxidase subunit 1/cytochrome c oxidase subunit I+III
LTTLGSTLLAVGILVSVLELVRSWRSGRRAVANPWAADTLEWAVPSPPPSFGFLRIPTVASLNPLWDDHDAFADPRNERVLDHGRQTLSTTALDAVPHAISQGELDTLLPLVLAATITGLFAALMTRALLMAGALSAIAIALAFGWLWPERKTA